MAWSPFPKLLEKLMQDIRTSDIEAAILDATGVQVNIGDLQ